jgi:hypothetical protein
VIPLKNKNIIITLITALLLAQTTLALQDPYTVYGYVTYQNSTPASGALVTMNAQNETKNTTTDTLGRYYITFENYQDGETITLTATLAEYEGTETHTINASQGGNRVDITLHDASPPQSITNLQAETQPHWINWSWDNPQDADFAYTMIYINNVFKVNTTHNYYNASFSPHETVEFKAYTVDTQGNINQTTVSLNATVANSPITLTAPTGVTGAEGETITIQLNATDADNDTPSYHTNRSDLFTINQTTGMASFTPAYNQSGTYHVEFSATDGYNSTDNITLTLIIQDIPLTITAQHNSENPNATVIQAYAGSTTHFSIHTNRTATSIKWYLNNTLMQEGTNTQYSHSWQQTGNYTLTVEATDGIDTANASWSIEVINYTFTYNITQGYNLISLPLETNYTAAEIANLSGAKYIITRTANTYQTYIKNFSSAEDNFNITPDKGYILYMVQNTSFNITGKIPSQRSVQLTPGWNLIGWTSLNTTNATEAFINPLGDSVRYVVKRTSTGSYQGYIKGFSGAEDDFTVEPGEAYYVYVTDNTTLTYR